MKTILWIAIVLLVAGGAYWAYVNTASEPETEEESGAASEETSSGALAGDNAVAASEQQPGSTAVVSMVVLAEPGYVVIHETNENGGPGAILGASAFLPAGTSNSVEIELSRASKDGEQLVAMLHTDNGDGEFGAADDTPVSENGNIIMMHFTTSADADTSVISI